ncbi:hypothetical protein ACE4WQ_003440 [Enterococcus faecalis]|uniref:hypothetical protein n=1 Tax=Enterococcus faecalis TaxID=1351 RepID=UPI0035EF5804
MLDKQEEKKIIYELMKELMVERRALSQQYYELKQYLDSLNQLPVEPSKKEFNRNNTLLEKEKIRSKDEFYKKISLQIIFHLTVYLKIFYRF